MKTIAKTYIYKGSTEDIICYEPSYDESADMILRESMQNAYLEHDNGWTWRTEIWEVPDDQASEYDNWGDRRGTILDAAEMTEEEWLSKDEEERPEEVPTYVEAQMLLGELMEAMETTGKITERSPLYIELRDFLWKIGNL